MYALTVYPHVSTYSTGDMNTKEQLKALVYNSHNAQSECVHCTSVLSVPVTKWFIYEHDLLNACYIQSK